MKYVLLLWPHANARYASGMFAPAEAELDVILTALGLSTRAQYTSIGGMDALAFETEALTPRAAKLIACHSLAYGFAEWRPDGCLFPISCAPCAYLGSDLAAIQKYKGKTNERFTQHLINMALFATDYFDLSALTLLDPMCGRGTTLYQAINRGWNAFGSDIDKRDVAECVSFFKRYLEYHKYKHAAVSKPRTLPGGRAVAFSGIQFADTREAFQAGDTRELLVACADAADAPVSLKKQSVHLICADLPYGVQHAPGEKGRATDFESLLTRVLPAWRLALVEGGAVAVAFNTYTLKTERVRDIMEVAGLTPIRGGAYDRLSHWVEQAVTRDLCVAVKR